MRTYLIPIAIVALCLSGAAPLSAQATSKNAEARVYFEEGNRLYAEAVEASDGERRALLQRALGAYVDSLGIARSRNALFNAAVVLEELNRSDEAFNYYSEYLAIDDLSAEDRAQGTARRDALLSKVALLRVSSAPPNAEVWIDRKDLAPLGVTPIEVAVRGGAHRVFFQKEGFFDESQTVDAAVGAQVKVAMTLRPLPTPEPSAPVSDLEPESKPRLRNAAIGTAAGAVATAAVGLGVAIRARALRSDYNAAIDRYDMTGDPADLAEAERLADRTDRFNIAADVMWGTAAALGVSAIVLYAVHRKRIRQDRIRVDLTANRRGGFASVTLSLGERP